MNENDASNFHAWALNQKIRWRFRRSFKHGMVESMARRQNPALMTQRSVCNGSQKR